MISIPRLEDLLDTNRSIAGGELSKLEYPSEALPIIGEIIARLLPSLSGFREISEGVFVSDSAKIWDNATVVGPCIIDEGAEIRPGAFIRGNAIIGKGAVIGNSTEIKNSIIFDKAQLPHYNYAGDSIIGYKAHMGAGAIASNLRLDKSEVVIKSAQGEFHTGLRKFGAILGDMAEIGCGCVLCPGTVIGRGTSVYPLCTVKGILPEYSICNGKTLKPIKNTQMG
jgi:NDP-sugar pyrophosphorylase family protein